jgi:hypothetical protein
MINEIKYHLNEEDEKNLESAQSGDSIFLHTQPNEFFDIKNSEINQSLYWDFVKKHPDINCLQIGNILDKGMDIIDQHVPFTYLLAEYNSDDNYSYLLILKFNPWHDDEENCFKISLTSSLKEAIDLLEQESEYVYSDNFDVDVPWLEIKEKLLIYDESKLINANIKDPNIRIKNKL